MLGKVSFCKISLFTASIFATGLTALLKTSAQAARPSGYYRISSRQEVYFLNSSSRSFCHVQDPSQMEVFGGFNQVQVVRNNSFMSGARYIGECVSPDGSLRPN